MTNPSIHDRAHEQIRVSRLVTGDFLSCRSPRPVTIPKPLINVNELYVLTTTFIFGNIR